MRPWVLFALLPGCDVIVGLQEHAAAPAIAPTCVNTVIDARFVASPPCAPWGSQFTNVQATLQYANNALEIHPRGTNSNAGCGTNQAVALTAGGVMTEVAAVTRGQDAYTSIELKEADIIIATSNNQLVFAPLYLTETYSTVTYEPDKMRWWRLRPDRDAGTIAGDYSPDGVEWKQFGEVARDIPATAQVVILAGFVQDIPTTADNVARFTALRVCNE